MLQVLLDAPTLPQPDTAPLMREIARAMETSVLLNFTQQRQPDGIPWLPSKRAQRDGGKTLIDTGKLLASVTAQSGADFAEVGFVHGDLPRWLHFGVPQNNLPARNILGFRKEDEDKILRLTARYIETLFQAA